MSKAIETKTDKQLVIAIHANLERAYELSSHPEAKEAIVRAYEDVKLLQHSNHDLTALVEGAQAAMAEMAKQRDYAIHDARMWKRSGEQLAMRILAGQIAVDGDIAVTDVVRVLEVLAGQKTTWEEDRLTEVYSTIAELAEALFEEQIYEAADDE